MPQKMLIDATHAEETRVVVVDGTKVEEFDFETAAKRQLAGNIYLAKVTRVEPSLQAAFVDYGGNRHGFLAFGEIHPDYYQIPVADRRALLEEERALAQAADDDNERPRRRSRSARAADGPGDTAIQSSDDIPGMAVIDAEEAGTAQDSAEDTGQDTAQDNGENASGSDDEASEQRPYAAVDHATESDEDIESVADEDVSDEIRTPRRSRLKKYKIQEVIKVRQILLVQVVKEERGNKGAALTTYLSLAGRYCVLMPNTARGGGISRKITQPADRKKLKEIANSIEVPEGMGLIIRTAGAKRTKAEIKRDYEYLMRLWDQIRDLTLKSVAPAPIYEEGNLIKRSIRDLYSRDIDEVLVEGAEGYRTAKDFMKMIMPSHAKNVKQYADQMPLFARFQVESYLGAMFNPTVQLKSGGYIVIGVTEALVAIDVNSGRATKEGSIEDTAVKTNLEAAEEIARQLRLRDLAGLIVIDFIDMEERKNNAAVEKKLKDKLKNDRARIQVGRISGFGLLEMSRQRLRPGMLESTTQPCPHCHGTGIVRSDDSLALQVLRQIEEEGTRARSREVLLRAPVGIVNFLMNQKRDHIALIEGRYGLSVRLEADPRLISPDFALERFKTATRQVVPVQQLVVSLESSAMDEAEDDVTEIDEAEEAEEATGETASASETRQDGSGDDNGSRKRRRRRRRRRGGAGEDSAEAGAEAGADAGAVQSSVDTDSDSDSDSDSGGTPAPVETATAAAPHTEGADLAAQAATETTAEDAPAVKRKPSRTRRPRKTAAVDAASEGQAAPEAGSAPVEAEAVAPEAPAPKPRRTRRRSPAAKTAPAQADTAEADTAAAAAADSAPVAVEETAPASATAPQPAPEPAAAAPAPRTDAEPQPEPQTATQAETVAAAADKANGASAAPAAGAAGDGNGHEEPAEDSRDAEVEPSAETRPPEADEVSPPPRRRGWWSARN